MYRITYRYSDRADYESYETAGYAEWLHKWLHDTGKRAQAVAPDLMSVLAEPTADGKSWEWLNPDKTV